MMSEGPFCSGILLVLRAENACSGRTIAHTCMIECCTLPGVLPLIAALSAAFAGPSFRVKRNLMMARKPQQTRRGTGPEGWGRPQPLDQRPRSSQSSTSCISRLAWGRGGGACTRNASFREHFSEPDQRCNGKIALDRLARWISLSFICLLWYQSIDDGPISVLGCPNSNSGIAWTRSLNYTEKLLTKRM